MLGQGLEDVTRAVRATVIERRTPARTYFSTRAGDWVFALLAIGLIPLFLETFAIWQWLQSILPPPVLEWLPIGLAVGLAIGALAWSVSMVGRGLVADSPWQRLAWLGIGLASAVVALQLTDPDFPAKKIHLFQIALLALIVRRAYGTRLSGLTLAAASIITVGLLGVHDELLQGLIRNAGSAWPIFWSMLCRRPPGRASRPRPRARW